VVEVVVVSGGESVEVMVLKEGWLVVSSSDGVVGGGE
jgi:hypothetical protein